MTKAAIAFAALIILTNTASAQQQRTIHDNTGMVIGHRTSRTSTNSLMIYDATGRNVGKVTGSALVIATLAAMTLINPAFARSSDLCGALWTQRNVYYKDAGYCFKTPRAIRYFGNAGCRYDEESAVPLSPSLRNRIADIDRAEHQLACIGPRWTARRIRRLSHGRCRQYQ
jgi:hypothetical protein